MQALKKDLRALAKEYGCTITFYSKKQEVRGSVAFPNGIIFNTYKLKKKEEAYTIFFHELGHIHCYKHRIWPSYHYLHTEKITNELIRKFKMTAYKAECWVDNWGRQEMKKRFPKLQYWSAYKPGDRICIEWLRSYYKSVFK